MFNETTFKASTTHQVDQNVTKFRGPSQARWGNTLANDFDKKKYMFLVKYGKTQIKKILYFKSVDSASFSPLKIKTSIDAFPLQNNY